MSILAPSVALFGITPLTLLLGRACCLDDNPPVGLFDPDAEAALRGALFLGISSRDPGQLDLPERPLRVALLGHPRARPGVESLSPDRGLLVVALYQLPSDDQPGHWCEALSDQALTSSEISSSVPALAFRLSGDESVMLEARTFLTALSSSITVTA